MRTNLDDYIGKEFAGAKVLNFAHVSLEIRQGRPINMFKCLLPCGHIQNVKQETLRKRYKAKCLKCNGVNIEMLK